MLKLTIPSKDLFDEAKNEFLPTDPIPIELEHSLVSLSKWESMYQKPFLSEYTKHTQQELLAYVYFMILTPNIDIEILARLEQKQLEEINAYIESKQSATTFGELPPTKGRGETITAELIYYWMIAFNLPVEFENWHLNRLFNLIRICNIKQSKPNKKMSKHEMAQKRRDLNEQRKRELGTKG